MADEANGAAAPSAWVEADVPQLGVLLVHGIGNHKQGETLNEFGARIVRT